MDTTPAPAPRDATGAVEIEIWTDRRDRLDARAGVVARALAARWGCGLPLLRLILLGVARGCAQQHTGAPWRELRWVELPDEAVRRALVLLEVWRQAPDAGRDARRLELEAALDAAPGVVPSLPELGYDPYADAPQPPGALDTWDDGTWATRTRREAEERAAAWRRYLRLSELVRAGQVEASPAGASLSTLLELVGEELEAEAPDAAQVARAVEMHAHKSLIHAARRAR